MKLAITSTGRELDSNLAPRFGRAAYFIVVDPDTMAFKVVENSQNLDLPQGAGIQAGKTIADHRYDVLITGHCGPKALKVLQKAGVEVMTCSGEKVIDAIAQFVHGEHEISAGADVEGHWV